jgi:hypothetical protein
LTLPAFASLKKEISETAGAGPLGVAECLLARTHQQAAALDQAE